MSVAVNDLTDSDLTDYARWPTCWPGSWPLGGQSSGGEEPVGRPGPRKIHVTAAALGLRQRLDPEELYASVEAGWEPPGDCERAALAVG
ncbi:hypothetical protein [Microbispora rosea]|uniref:hypothetical protein n=1 Tax=Microbispora rosea TaxID=58117 RepID=UPI0004C46C35|nr:hypothetical protein [Microbispora rosea]